MPEIGQSDCKRETYVLESFLLIRKDEIEAQKTDELKSDPENKAIGSRGPGVPPTQENTKRPHKGNKKPDRQH
jgi:hypothetical protein